MAYDYRQAVTNDVMEYIREEVDPKDYRDADDLYEHLVDELWAVDSVTGNGSGSYTFNRWTAERYVADNVGLLAEAVRDMGDDPATVGRWFLNEEWETMDVIIRCYLLGECIGAALEKMDLVYGEDQE